MEGNSSVEAVKVYVRCRPVNESEKKRRTDECVSFPSKNSVLLSNADKKDETKQFTFDGVFDTKATQAEVFDKAAAPVIDEVLKGFNGTLFVYGQTSSGKTFTMQGDPANDSLKGVIPRTFSRIFQHISKVPNRRFLTHVSYYEIYNEDVRDLLAPVGKVKQALEVKEKPESGFYVKDLSAINVKNEHDMMKLLETGNRNRSVGATLMNEQSSRSHSVFIINIESCELDNNSSSKNDEKSHIIVGKLCLVDLAGSERLPKTGSSGERLKEATKINLSLSALGNCISALVDGKSTHIPYRDSKLTKLLQDSLGGNAKTSMIATISPVAYNYEETVSTLRYANRAKNINNKPKVNQDPKDALLKDYQAEIERLKVLLNQKRAVTAKSRDSQSPDSFGLSTTSLQRKSMKDINEKIMKESLAAEKATLSRELSSKQLEIEKEKQARAELAAKLEEMESRFVLGGEWTKKIDSQKALLDAQKVELDNKRSKENTLKKKVGVNSSVKSNLDEKYCSLQDEIDVKTKKLKRLWVKLDEIKEEKKRIHSEFSNERQELQEAIHELTKELSLKDKLIEDFIPPLVKEDLDKRTVYVEETNEWILKPREKKTFKIFPRPKINADSMYPDLALSTRFYLSRNIPSLRHRPFNILVNELEYSPETD